MASYYSAWPYPHGTNPPYPIPGRVGPGPIFDGQYATNIVSDPTLQYMLDETNVTQQAYYNDANRYDPNMAWYNSAIAPYLTDAYNKTQSILRQPIPPTSMQRPGMPPPQGAMPPAQEEKKGSLLGSVAGGAAVGGIVGGFLGGGVFSWATAGVGAAIGGVVGGIKHFLFD
ncbi:MAG TPA: hypothetical protein V6C99_00970 [Oculatellaceae cyanobacterium]|jgi:hypothetical protein